MKCGDCNKDSLTRRLNKRVIVLKDEEQENEYGEVISVLSPVMTIWAAVEPLRGREFISAFAEHAEVTTRIRIRYRTGIDRTMTVRCGDSDFEILHIIHTNFDKVELQLMCKERQ